MIEIYGFVNGMWLDTFLPRGSLDGHLCNPAPARRNTMSRYVIVLGAEDQRFKTSVA
jgi:hypothetical protein